jgi:hypothetical protein
LALSVFAVSCGFNVFGPIDGPRGDAQLISAARAALDRGDFEEAVEYYKRLENNADVKASEQAFAYMAKHNVGMKTIAAAFGSGSNVNAGKAITLIANAIGSDAGAATRLELFHAYQLHASVTEPSLKGFVRFLGALALLADMVAEGASNPSHITPADLVLTPESCTKAVCAVPPVPGNPDCGKPSGSALNSGPTTPIDLADASTTDAVISDSTFAPTLSLIQSAIVEIKLGLNQINSSGNLASSLEAFTSSFDGVALLNEGPCYRAGLVDTGIGSY